MRSVVKCIVFCVSILFVCALFPLISQGQMPDKQRDRAAPLSSFFKIGQICIFLCE